MYIFNFLLLAVYIVLVVASPITRSDEVEREDNTQTARLGRRITSSSSTTPADLPSCSADSVTGYRAQSYHRYFSGTAFIKHMGGATVGALRTFSADTFSSCDALAQCGRTTGYGNANSFQLFYRQHAQAWTCLPYNSSESGGVETISKDRLKDEDVGNVYGFTSLNLWEPAHL